jgi:DNA invertase Pin-like site-specific DNA recombinase
LDYRRGRDTLVVTKVDRLARSTVGLWEIVKRLEAVEDGEAGLRVLNLGGETVDTKSATGKLILTVEARSHHQSGRPAWLRSGATRRPFCLGALRA